MKPDAAPTRRNSTTATPALREAATVARDAAEALAEEGAGNRDAARFRTVADRMTVALDDRDVTRYRLLASSPAVIERSGRAKTLIEMIEAEPEDEGSRLRLAKLLLRALTWDPESIPD